MNTTDDIKALIARRKKELKEIEYFDSLPKAEQARRTAAGLNPHEPREIREKKKAAVKEQRIKEFRKLPKKEQEILKSFGLDPSDDEAITIRIHGYFTKIGDQY